ncbi:MAG: class I SAM-dependent methyltransferase [Planctomycetota bacterium]
MFDTDPARLDAALALLRAKGFEARPAPALGELCVQGRATTFLWEPSPLLARALARLGAGSGPAIDLACGTGRDAVTLARAGYEVTAVDVDAWALERAAELAGRCGVELRCEQLDLEADLVRLPDGPFSFVNVSRFLHRPLFPAIRDAVAPGGVVCYQTFEVGERERSGRPRRDRFLLQPGELLEVFSHEHGFTTIAEQHGIEEGGRCMHGVVARRRSSP